MENLATPERLSALKWYFESKNLSLKNALSLRTPLQAEQQKELRQYYSEYFASLISATELLFEDAYPHKAQFSAALYAGFVFDQLPDGEHNYSYIRELRNSVIHRGLDLCSAGHAYGDKLMIVAPSPVTNQRGTKSFAALGNYLLDIIWRCECVLCPIVAQHAEQVGILKPPLTQDQALILAKDFISQSKAMPDWAKTMAVSTLSGMDLVAAQIQGMKDISDTLNSTVAAQSVGEYLSAVALVASDTQEPQG